VTKETSQQNQIVCPYCKRTITLPAVSLGTTEKCPHCDIEFVVSSRLVKETTEPVVDTVPDFVDGYDLQVKPAETGPRNVPRFRTPAVDEDPDAAAEAASWRPMSTPPLGLFFTHTFRFPLSAGPRAWYLALLLFGVAAVGAVFLTIYFSSFPSDDIFSADKWFASAMLTGLTTILGLLGLLLFSSVCLTVMRETSEGLSEFKDQQIGWFTEWFEESVYLGSNLFYGALPAIIVFSIFTVQMDIKLTVYLLLEIFLFPLFLMSALERKSAVTPFSKPVWKSLWFAWHAWVLFYLLTLLICETFVYCLRMIPFGSIQVRCFFAACVAPFVLIVYFRLLGRLAWFCSGRFDENYKNPRYDP
jgi:hypothetical protein